VPAANSHHDFDHAAGAAVFNDTAEVIGHAEFNGELKRAQTVVPEFFAALDTNSNARFEKSELTGPFGAFLAQQDRNGDGTVTPAELYTDVIPTEASYSGRRLVTLGGKTVEMRQHRRGVRVAAGTIARHLSRSRTTETQRHRDTEIPRLHASCSWNSEEADLTSATASEDPP
jgi:hypothetical protein